MFIKLLFIVFTCRHTLIETPTWRAKQVSAAYQLFFTGLSVQLTDDAFYIQVNTSAQYEGHMFRARFTNSLQHKPSFVVKKKKNYCQDIACICGSYVLGLGETIPCLRPEVSEWFPLCGGDRF